MGEPPAQTSPSWVVVRSFLLSQAEFSHACAWAPEFKGMRWVALPCAGLSIGVGLVAGYFGWHTGLLYLLGLYILAEVWWFVSKQAQATQRLLGVTQHWTLTPEQIRIDLEGGALGAPMCQTLCYRWQQLSGHYSCPGLLVLLDPNGGPLLVPSLLLTPDERALLHAALNQALSPHRMYKSWLRIALVGLVLVGGWLFWDVPWVRAWVGG